MINQYQPLDSGPFRDTLFSDQSKSKGHTIFPKTATSWPHKPTNLVFQVLSVDHLVLKKKEFPNKSPLGLLELTHHILWSSNFGEKPRLQASDDWKFSHLPVELDPPTGLCRISRQTLGDEPVKLAGMQQYAGIWNEHVRVVPLSHTYSHMMFCLLLKLLKVPTNTWCFFCCFPGFPKKQGFLHQERTRDLTDLLDLQAKPVNWHSEPALYGVVLVPCGANFFSGKCWHWIHEFSEDRAIWNWSFCHARTLWIHDFLTFHASF